jgi:hypothetical protein
LVGHADGDASDARLESSHVRWAHKARSYEGQGKSAKPRAALTNWPCLSACPHLVRPTCFIYVARSQ